MITFSLPTFRYVFKVIRDISTKPTFAGPQHVKQQYWRVHRMDRVGRMLDIMTFHNLRFSQDLFAPELLDTLAQAAPSNVDITHGQVVFRHLYAEREVFPLDVFLRDESFSVQVRNQAAVDYGRAIKDLAATGIFVGDYMTKNFGVTRYGRVVLYDCDDLDDLTQWNFRHLPEAPEWAECLDYDDWLSKGPYDMFPEHGLRLFCVPAGFREVFLEHHGDILTPDYWNRIKTELLAGNIPEFYPYPLSKRLEA
jgi:isocitrate dehydrogenase kinase/phosphatase